MKEKSAEFTKNTKKKDKKLRVAKKTNPKRENGDIYETSVQVRVNKSDSSQPFNYVKEYSTWSMD